MTQGSDIFLIGGFGHVGLPLGITLAGLGMRVVLFDIDTSKRASIEAGRMPFLEEGAEEVLRKVIGKTLMVSTKLSDAVQSKVILITIGTPVDEYLSPKTQPLLTLADALIPHLRPDHLIILRSTVYPGTSQVLAEHFRAQGREIHLAYCPERIVQGRAMRELRELPQVIAGTSAEALSQAHELFRRLGVETIEVDLEEAELTKLFLNAWRYMQFAVGNQFYMMAKDRGLDYKRIYHAMTHHYTRGDLPGPGFAAGPCLLKDTMQLAAAYRNQFLLGHASMMVNENLPAFLVEHLERDVGTLRGKTVGILGMAFKADIDDPRDALSFKLAKILRFRGANVLCSDEHIHDSSFLSTEELLKRAAILIVGVPHAAYRTLRVPQGKQVLDLWNCLSHA